MKKQFLAILCVFTINGIAIADDTQTRLKAMEAERDSVFKHKGNNEPYYSENCPKELAFWQQAAEQGQPIAQSLLAGCYVYGKGKGIVKDENQAVAWYRKAAEQGNAWAQFGLGKMYLQGNDLDVTAQKIIKKADDALYSSKQNGRNRIVVGL
jgi:TPR repeat protein